MKRYIKVLLFITIVYFVSITNVFAYSSSNYVNKGLCGTYELDAFKSNGDIIKVGCYGSYNDAKSAMRSNGSDDLGILTKVGSTNKLVDANVALLDLSVNPTTLTYFYKDADLRSNHTYMDTGSLYGGVDGVHVDSAYSNYQGKWVAQVQIGSLKAWIPSEAYEIVPLTWVKSSSSYTVTSDSIRHNYVAKIQNTYNGSAGNTIGPKPNMLNTGTYYSYDGHYFYQSLNKLIKDVKRGVTTNAVNQTPYYNYYMYLSNHTKTTYSSINIDEYIRNNMGINGDAFGNAASSGKSRLYGQGTFFYYSQEKYGVNAVLSLSLSRNETGNGKSNLAINKNNGFGLNAVDSNPYQAANWYASFASSIMGYASRWITNGYAKATDWRYFGPQFGEKLSGMNVKYASDTYWSEKMAANYYSLDRAYGLQDYNYYQEAVTKGATNAYLGPSTSDRKIYTYPEAEDALVIVGEVEGSNVDGSTKWYKVMSDINIDKNGNQVSGDYNWTTNYVYVPSAHIKTINTPKNKYNKIEDITPYQDSKYTYDLYVENNNLKLKVGQTLKNTPYYFDSTLTKKTGATVLKDKFVMVYSAAYNEKGQIVAYLVTSDYKYNQKHWVPADSIKFVTTGYGKVTVSVSGNQYTWVNYNTVDASYSLISGLYTNSYVPCLTAQVVDGQIWYKVPVSLTSNDNSYGWTLANAPGVSVELIMYYAENNHPTITAQDKEITEGKEFKPLEGVTAYDTEDGDITSKIKVTENTVNTKTPGEYKVTYEVSDNNNNKVTKTIKVKVLENKAPVINAKDIELELNDEFKELDGVTATDEEDKDLTNKIKVTENTVNTKTPGEYKVTYQVTDSGNKTTSKTIKVVVKEEVVEEPIEEVLEDLKEAKGEFDLDNLKWDNTSKKYTLSGYLKILNQDNSKQAKYELILKDKISDKEYSIDVDSWTKDVPYDLGKENGYDYSNSWFKGQIDLSNIPNGDYDLYMKATKGNYYTKEIVSNIFNVDIDKRTKTETQGYNFKVMLSLKSKKLELNIRDNLITTSTANTFRNMVNSYDDIKFVGNNIKLIGTSYNYDGTYNNPLNITRKIILEDNKTYKQYNYDLGSTNKGSYEVISTDNKSKEYAWFDKEIDISSLPKGNYTILIYTKTVDSEDYGELNDIFQSINNAEATINGKHYKVTLNKNRNNRIELNVE